MRLIDADRFKDNIMSGLYVFCQENKEDIARAIDSEPTVKPIIVNAPTSEYPCVIKVKTEVDAQRVSDKLRRLAKMGVIFPVEDIEVKRLQRPQGEWLIECGNTFHFSCSQCGCAGSQWDKFCRHCGAKMRKGGAE